MIVPCMVNSWLYGSGARNCIPGRASSARMNRAIRPPIMNQVNEVAMYISPRTLGSVVCRYCRNLLPRGARCTGYGRDTTRRGATAVTLASQQVGALTGGQTPPTSTMVVRIARNVPYQPGAPQRCGAAIVSGIEAGGGPLADAFLTARGGVPHSRSRTPPVMPIAVAMGYPTE